METKETLKLSDIACYLPYGLKMQVKNLGILELTDISLDKEYPCWFRTFGDYENPDFNYRILTHNNCIGKGYILSEIKPILRPISDLYKPLKNGNIPAIEIAKLVDNGHNHTDSIVKSYGVGHIRVYTEKCDDVEAVNLRFDNDGLNSISKFGEAIHIRTFLRIQDYLNEHHFDYKNLIGRGLAIDINTIKL